MDVARAKWCWVFLLMVGVVTGLTARAAENAGTVAAQIVKNAKALRKEGKEDEADKMLRDAAKSCEGRLQQQPDDAQAHFALAQLQVHLDQVETAKRHLDRAMELEPNNAAMYSFLGRYHGVAKEYREAIKAYRRSLELDPKDTETKLMLATCLGNLNETDEALLHASELLRLAPNDYGAVTFYAFILLQAGKYEEWERTMRSAINSQPQNKELREFFVVGFIGQQRFERAYRECLELQKLDPADVSIEEKLIFLATNARQPGLAATHIDRLRELHRQGKFTDATFARDHFFVGQRRVGVAEHFELKNGEGIKIDFHVMKENEEHDYSVSLAKSATFNANLVRTGQLKDAGKGFVLVRSQDGKTDIFAIFQELPTYDEVRTMVIEVVEGSRQPWLSARQAAENKEQTPKR